MPTNPQESEYSYDNHDDQKVSTGLIEDTVTKIGEEKRQLKTNSEISLQINEIIEKNEGVWRCKICGKTATANSNIRNNAELHIEGISHDCHICSKTFTNRNNLKVHISRNHRGAYKEK